MNQIEQHTVMLQTDGFKDRISDYMWDGLIAQLNSRGQMSEGWLYGEYAPTFTNNHGDFDNIRFFTTQVNNVIYRIIDITHSGNGDIKMTFEWVKGNQVTDMVQERFKKNPSQFRFIPRLMMDPMGVKGILVTVDMFMEKSGEQSSSIDITDLVNAALNKG